jgi:hypothetical protein
LPPGDIWQRKNSALRRLIELYAEEGVGIGLALVNLTMLYPWKEQRYLLLANGTLAFSE